MRKEKVIITKLRITTAGQIVHFQVKIPRDAERIIGMEVSAQLPPQQQVSNIIIGNTHLLVNASPNPFRYLPNTLLGDVRLQSCEDTNIFFADNIYAPDANVGYGDYSGTGFQPAPETHGLKRYECIANTKGETTILKGIYRDRQAPNVAQVHTFILSGPQPITSNPSAIFSAYTAGIYVWYEIKTHKA